MALAITALAGMPHAEAMVAAAPAISERRMEILRGGGRRSLQRFGYRKKPWTCTAIEKRKASKRRNVKRHRARRRA